MTKKQRKENKAGNQERKQLILSAARHGHFKFRSYFAFLGAIQNGKGRK